MIIKPEMRGMIFVNVHPWGCAKNVSDQIDYIKKQPAIANGPTRVLIIGASTGYGLASRIVSAFGCGAATIGVYYEKECSEKRTATAGWYHAHVFEQAAGQAGLFAKNFNSDAFSDETKRDVITTIKRDWGAIDLLVYSVVAPRRINPKTGLLAKTFVKPLNAAYTERSYDFIHDQIVTLTIPPATQQEISQTIEVLGGEDWELWVRELAAADLLAPKFSTVAFSYIGSDIARPIYRDGTIGAAKEHLEQTARRMNAGLALKNGRAVISVNKAILTQASSIIPFVSLYLILLTKVMREKGIDENSVQQIYRLFQTRLYAPGPLALDNEGRIRLDDLEMRSAVQRDVNKLWHQITNENLHNLINVKDFKKEYLRLYGFEVPGIDYEAEVDLKKIADLLKIVPS